MPKVIALLNGREKIIDLFRDQVHFAPQEDKHQKEKEEVNDPENPENIHKRREGTVNGLQGIEVL